MHQKGETYIFTGTTKDEQLANEIEDAIESDDDLTEARLVRDAMREYLGDE